MTAIAAVAMIYGEVRQQAAVLSFLACSG